MKHGSSVLTGPQTPASISVLWMGELIRSLPSQEPRGFLDRAHPEDRRDWVGRARDMRYVSSLAYLLHEAPDMWSGFCGLPEAEGGPQGSDVSAPL